MQEKFDGNFDEKVLKWIEETKEKELMIRFFGRGKAEGAASRERKSNGVLDKFQLC